MNLKELILSLSSNLMELPDQSRTKNPATIVLRSCVRLTSMHPSVFSLNKLEKLDLGGRFLFGEAIRHHALRLNRFHELNDRASLSNRTQEKLSLLFDVMAQK